MHSVWRGALSFGLVNIPVRLYHSSKEREFKFHLLHKKDLSEIRYARICKTDGKEVPWEDVVKGFDVGGGQFVVFTEEDFEKVNPKKSSSIEILDFTAEDQIDPVFFYIPYYLEPEKGAEKAYALLREALKKTGKVGIGRYVFRNHEHIGMIKAQGDLILLVQLRYAEDLLTAKDLNIPREKEIPKRELDMAVQFINKLTSKFTPTSYKDSYTQELKEMIKKKSKGKKVTVKKGEEPVSPKVHDIMSLLKKSLEEEERPKKKLKKSA